MSKTCGLFLVVMEVVQSFEFFLEAEVVALPTHEVEIPQLVTYWVTVDRVPDHVVVKAMA